jgi:glycosyltransferase involved in cell wall biosynthesis
MEIKSSLIISTYNWPEALNLVLLSVKDQYILPKEVIIADDGSGDATKELIDSFKQDFPVPLIHVWHEDKGFRLAEIRNKAISSVTSDYVIQVDGDTVLHKHFINDHLRAAEKGFFISGSRVLVDKIGTENAQKNFKINFHFLSKNIKNRLNTLRIPFLSPYFEKKTYNLEKASSTVRGCNMSFWLNDLKQTNGYCVEMTGWGFEDWELSARLINSGLGKKRIKFGAILFHQYHELHEKSGININEELYNITIREKLIICKNGIQKLE